MPRINWSSLKFRLTTVVVGLVLLAASVVTFVSMTLAERQMHGVVGSQQVALLTSAAATIEQDLAAKQTMLKLLREELGGTPARAPATLQQFLEAHPALRDEFFNVLVFDAGGAVLANLADRRINPALNFSKRAYFTDTVADREGVISQPFKSTLSGKPVILVTEPVYDGAGKLLYILGGAIDLQRPSFFGQLEALKPGASGYLFMLTKDGTIIHHPEPARILQNVTAEAGGAVPSTLAAMNGFEGWVDGPNKRGVHALISYKRLNRVNWILGAVYPVDEAFAPFAGMRRNALIASALVALLAGAAGWLAIWKVLRPLGALRRHAAAIADGNADIAVFDVVRKDEFGELSRAFFRLSQQRQAAEGELAALARTDSLTGLYNRRMFEEVFAQAQARAARAGTGLALAYLDIDNFKSINDTYGHKAGDLVLVEFARRLQAAVRTTDTVARLAGDEFVAIFEGLPTGADPGAMSAKILAMSDQPVSVGGKDLPVTSSIGIAVGAGTGATLDEFLMAADEALYAAKKAGRHRCVVRKLAR